MTSTTADGPYTAAWRDFRRRQWLMAATYLAFFPGEWLLSAISTRMPLERRQEIYVIAGFAWFITFIASGFWASAWRCPRCHQEFTKATWYRNPMTRQCLSCGLPRWAPDDPRLSNPS